MWDISPTLPPQLACPNKGYHVWVNIGFLKTLEDKKEVVTKVSQHQRFTRSKENIYLFATRLKKIELHLTVASVKIFNKISVTVNL